MNWQYDEFKQVGKDYSNPEEVDIYDSSHADFRDIQAESNQVLDTLNLTTESVLIDYGSGTGTFAIEASRRCSKIHAIDVSQAMIDLAKKKAEQAKISNIDFSHAGFLTYNHNGPPVDAIVTTFAFHHLPDFWKGIALKRMNRQLKPKGQLYIHDVILEEGGALENISRLIKKQEEAGGDFLRKDAEEHFREEYSTYDWVMDGLLTRAGFEIKKKTIEGGVIGKYWCVKK